MIDVSNKSNTLRYAKAQGKLKTIAQVIELLKTRQVPKGDVLEIARAAGVSAAKRCSEWIVFCHPLPLDWIELSFELGEDSVTVFAEIKAIWKTGVEMEAITAVMAALLNIYDMLKPLTGEITISEISLVEKKGGKSDFVEPLGRKLDAAVLVVSDSTYEGKRIDKSGKIICDFLKDQPVAVKFYETFPDDADMVSRRLTELIDKEKIELIFTTGGTGLGPRDLTPEATKAVIEKEVPGIEEAIRSYGKDRTPYAMLSREVAGMRGRSLIINLPGSSRGVEEGLRALFPGLLHAFPMMWGKGHSPRHP